jgi:hypothetical protein
MNTAAGTNSTRRYRRTALALCVLALLVGCGPLERETEITPQEIDAAKDIRVVFRNLNPQLTAHVSAQYIHEGRLYIDGNVLNSSQRDLNNVALRVFVYDTLDRPIAADTPTIFTVPQSLPPGVSGHFSIDLDPTDVAVVIIESAN